MLFQHTLQAEENPLKTGISFRSYRHAFPRFEPHRHMHIEFFYVVQNTVTLYLEDVPCLCREGDLIIFPAMASHAVGFTNGDVSEHLIIQADISYMLQGREDLTRKNIRLGKGVGTNSANFVYHTQLRPDISNILLNIYKICRDYDIHEEPSIPDSWRMRAQFFHLLHILLENEIITISEADDDMPDIPTLLQIQPVLKILNEDPARRIAVDEAAKLSHMSYYNFSRTFKRLLGWSFVEYQNLLRVRCAQGFLSATGLSMAEISLRLNFETQSHFNHIFKRYCGITPLEYRRKTTGLQNQANIRQNSV